MANTKTPFLGLILSAELSAASKYNLNRIDSLGEIFRFADNGDTLITGDAAIKLSTEAGGAIELGNISRQLSEIRIFADVLDLNNATLINVTVPWSLLTFSGSSLTDIEDRSHTDLSDIGSNTHPEIDSHITDTTIHFVKTAISHTDLLDKGTNTHTQLDTHLASSSNIHGVQGSIVGTESTQTLQNKTLVATTLNADLNTITNIDNADIKAGAGIAQSKISGLVSDLASKEPTVDRKDISGTTGRTVVTGGTGAAFEDVGVNVSTDLLPSPVAGDIGKVLLATGAGSSEWYPISVDDSKVKISVTDTTSSYLEDKLLAGDAISLTKALDPGDSTLTIANTDKGSSAVTTHLSAIDHDPIVHSNRSDLDLVSGTNTGDEDKTSIETKLGAAATDNDGYLSSTDWDTFNGKEPALTKGNLTGTTNRLSVTGGTGAIIGTGTSLDISTGLLPSPVLLDAGKSLVVTGADTAAWATLSHGSLTDRSSANSHPATAITNTPSGNLAATEVQAALNELQSDVDSRAPSSTAVTLAGVQTLTNKTLSDTTTSIGAVGALTKALKFLLSGATADKTMTLLSSHTDDRTLTLPDATDTLVGKATTDTFTNKTLSDTTTVFGAVGALTKALKFLLSGATAGKTMTIASAHTDDRTLTLPDATDTLVGKATTDTLTNKKLNGGTASTSNEWLLPTKADQAGLSSTAGNVMFDTASKKVRIYDGSAWKVVGGGLIPTHADVAATLSAGKTYTIDLSAAAADVTYTLPVMTAEDQLLCYVGNNSATAYRAIFATSGGQLVGYYGSEGDSIKVVDACTWIGFIWDSVTSRIVCYDAKLAIDNTRHVDALSWTGAGPYTMTITGATHRRGVNPVVIVRQTATGVSSDVLLESVQVSDATGDVVLTSTEEITGKVIII